MSIMIYWEAEKMPYSLPMEEKSWNYEDRRSLFDNNVEALIKLQH